MRKLLWSLCALFVAVSLFAAEPEKIAGDWIIYGTAEDAPRQVAYVVAKELGTTPARWLVGAHELIAVGKKSDGSIFRVYREEACLLYVDEDEDMTLTPKERRWKTPADHACSLTHRRTSFIVDVDAEHNILLHVRTPPEKKREEEQIAISTIRPAGQASAVSINSRRCPPTCRKAPLLFRPPAPVRRGVVRCASYRL